MIKFGVFTTENNIKNYLPAHTNESRYGISSLCYSGEPSPSAPSALSSVSYRELIRDSDAILFMDRGSFYPDLLEEVLKQFKPVLLYYPLSISRTDSFNLLKIVDEANVQVFRAHPFLNSDIWNRVKETSFNTLQQEIRRSFLKNFTLQEVKRKLIEDVEFCFFLSGGNPVKVFANGNGSDNRYPGFFSTYIEYDNGKTSYLSYNFIQGEEQIIVDLYGVDELFRIDFLKAVSKHYTLDRRGQNSEKDPTTFLNETIIGSSTNTDLYKTAIERFYLQIADQVQPEITLENNLAACQIADQVIAKIPNLSISFVRKEEPATR